MRSLVSATVVGFLVLSPASAQQEAPSPILELTSGHHSIVWQVARSLAGEDFGNLQIPEPDRGRQLRLVLDADEKVAVQAVPTGEHVLEFRLHKKPELLGKIAAEQLGPAARILHMTVFMILSGKMQMEGRHAARAIQSAMRFHHQLQDLHLTVQKTKESANSYGIDLWVTPKKGTWLREVVEGIEPGKQGAPHLRSPNATLQVTAAVQGKGLQRFLEPFADHLGRIRGQDRKEREEFMALARGRLDHFDGSFGLMIDGPGRYVRLVGLTRPEEYGKLAARKNVQAFDCRRAGRADVVFAAQKDLPAALAGSGVQVLLKETDPFALTEDAADTEDNKDKVPLTTFAGVVEDFSLKARLPEEGKEMARLVARVRQQQLRRMPLLEGALLRARVNLGLGMRLGPHGNKELEEALEGYKEIMDDLFARVPETYDIAVFKRSAKLHVRVRTR